MSGNETYLILNESDGQVRLNFKQKMRTNQKGLIYNKTGSTGNETQYKRYLLSHLMLLWVISDRHYEMHAVVSKS